MLKRFPESIWAWNKDNKHNGLAYYTPRGFSIVVEYSSHRSKVEGSNPGSFFKLRNRICYWLDQNICSRKFVVQILFLCRQKWSLLTHCTRWALPGNPCWRGRLSTADLLVPTSLDQLLSKLKITYLRFKSSYLNEEVNCTDPSLAVSIPWPYNVLNQAEERGDGRGRGREKV